MKKKNSLCKIFKMINVTECKLSNKKYWVTALIVGAMMHCNLKYCWGNTFVLTAGKKAKWKRNFIRFKQILKNNKTQWKISLYLLVCLHTNYKNTTFPDG